jgi:hypothetical protein
MSKTVIALYDDFDNARRAVEALVDAGFARSDISMIANDTSGDYGRYLTENPDYATMGDTTLDDDVKADEGAGFGAVVGTLVGLGAALIPGVGPVVVAGPAFAALFAGIGAAAGAATGGLTASLINLGATDDDAGHYAEGVRRGGTLVTVTADDNVVLQIQDILEDYGPVNVRERVSDWQTTGYSGFDENASYPSRDSSRDTTGSSFSGMDSASAGYIGAAAMNTGTGVGVGASGVAGAAMASAMDEADRNANRFDSSFEGDTYLEDWRTHYNSNYANSGYTFEQYTPAYRYGYSLANATQYQGRNWDEIEADARTRWEERNPGTWDRFKDSVRHTWERVTR